MLMALILAAAPPITVVASLDDPAELLRFRAAICEAWEKRQAVTLWGSRSSAEATICAASSPASSGSAR